MSTSDASRAATASRAALRVGDLDRDAAAERLRVAYTEGRLSGEELEDRLGRALAARTAADLDGLIGDLPALPDLPAPRVGRLPHRAAACGSDRVTWTSWLVATVVNVVIWALVSAGVGELVYFWPMWVAGPWGAVLASRALSGHTSGCSRTTKLG